MPNVKIEQVRTASDLEAVKQLCEDFRRWLYKRYADQSWLIDTYYNPENWAKVLDGLAEEHRQPDGAMLLATMDGTPAGCVMMRPSADGACEMKRLYVSSAARGLGMATALCKQLIRAAEARGYRSMLLDTGKRHDEAVPLYRKLGFKMRDPFYDCSETLSRNLIFMERPLAA